MKKNIFFAVIVASLIFISCSGTKQNTQTESQFQLRATALKQELSKISQKLNNQKAILKKMRNEKIVLDSSVKYLQEKINQNVVSEEKLIAEKEKLIAEEEVQNRIKSLNRKIASLNNQKKIQEQQLLKNADEKYLLRTEINRLEKERAKILYENSKKLLKADKMKSLIFPFVILGLIILILNLIMSFIKIKRAKRT